MNGIRTFACFADRTDGDVCAFVGGISDGKNAVLRCPESQLVSGNRTASGGFKCFKAVNLCFLTDRHNDGVKIQCFKFAFNRNRFASAAFIRFTKCHFLKLNAGYFIVFSQNLFRI
ncbi:hypothetical protein SDC9_175686 [bioreactor metagenome]|uniref:Uncharacterized protein n=1 Tax=bioreactor metagenome TaxID=1076179 RepID=A0A645GNE4_9ZZZZ